MIYIQNTQVTLKTQPKENKQPNFKIDKRSEQTLQQRKYANGK